ncbi:MATE family efflux transporter [Acidihalobacter ferrooxydans]|uniref:MATE family efflux transporter n=1 Tax=Acidihalobacter ferrooxydans TaxID=1765967 RepID=A0A1P8UJL7_9GAMM|nr:MATE family efflux transporter [Acidihalobacter ferrooxydans]APZ43984.1 MATE family efflux transporter [Acidihalobacter ferrooxydans]
MQSSPNRLDGAVWRLAWPIILSNVTVPLLGLVDTAVVGHLPASRYLAAVTLGATLLSFLYWGFGFLRMGTTGLTAQAHGRQDVEALRALLGQSLIVAVTIGLALIVFGHPLVRFGLDLLGGTPEAVRLAAQYAHIRLLSAPAALANYVILGWFLGIGNARVTLAIMVLTNAVNIALDLLFVVGFGMTSNGVALGSTIANYVAFGFGLWLLRGALRELGGGPVPRARLWRGSAYAALFAVNRHLFVRTLCLLFALAFFAARGASMGDTVLAANAVLMQYVMLTAYGLDGFAQAAESLIGKAVGRRDWVLFGASVRAALRFSLFTSVLATVVFALAGPALIALLTSLPAVRAAAAGQLGWLIVLPLLTVWSYLFDGVFVGATATREMRDSMLVSLALFLLAWWLSRRWGNDGLWFAFAVFSAARSLTLALIYRQYRRSRWQDAHT